MPNKSLQAHTNYCISAPLTSIDYQKPQSKCHNDTADEKSLTNRFKRAVQQRSSWW